MSRLAAVVILGVSSLALAQAPVKYELDGNRLKVPHPIVFATGKATVDAKQSAAAVTYIKGYLDAKSYVSTLRVEVHADGVGDEKVNQALTEKRALAVARALVAKGVDCKRLVAVGFGSTKPVADTKTPEGRAQNRRTELVNAGLRGKPIGGMPLDGGGKVAGDVCVKAATSR